MNNAAAATAPRRTYPATCTNCGTTYQSRRRSYPANVRHTCGTPACLAASTAAHNADVKAHQEAKAARPRRARKTVAHVPASDWNQLVAFSRPIR